MFANACRLVERYLGRLLVASTIALGAVMLPAAASMAAAPDHPLAPPGFHPDLSPPAGVAVSTEVVTLPAGTCAAMNHALVAAGKPAQADCRAIHTSYGQNHLPVPAGATASRGLFSGATAQAAAAYWYWSWSDQECSIYGCWYWDVNLSEDGVANGTNVWQWSGAQCTASGYNTTCGWRGYYYNGGGWPNYAMQFGENSTSCAYINGGPACFGHGQRRWIDDWGNPAGYYNW